MKSRLKQILNKGITFQVILIVLAFTYFTLNSVTKINNHLSWDELNYEDLSRKGILYNALEKNSLSFVAFYKIGKARADKDTLLNSKLVKQYSYPDENENPFYLRHYHPPLANYYWSLFINKESIKDNDKSLRVSNVILGVLAIFSLIISLMIAKVISLRSFKMLLLIASILLLSNVFNYSFERLNFHTFQFIFSVIFLGSLLRWLNNPKKSNAFILGITMSLMFLSLETAAFVVAGSCVGIFIIKKIRILLKYFWVILFSFLLGLIALWPGVIKTLAPIKTWIMYGARLFLKGNDEYAGVSVSEAWGLLFVENALIFTVIIITSLCLIVISKRQSLPSTYLLPYVIATFYLLAITPFILNKTYVLPVIGLFLFAISYNLSLINWKNYKLLFNSFNYSFIIIVSVLLVLRFVNLDFSKALNENKLSRIEFEKDVERLQKLLTDKKNIIAFNGQQLRYYLGRKDVIDMRKNTMANPGYFVREEGLYTDITYKLRVQEIGAVVFPKENISYYPEDRTKILEDFNYKKIDLKHYRIFLSQKNSGY